MPRKANCLVVDDHYTHRAMVKGHLVASGHVVVAEAENEVAALELVGQLGQLGVTVALLDGNLTPDENDGQDGERIAKAIRELKLGIHIVCVSKKFEGYPWADHNVFKMDMVDDWLLLPKLVDSL